MNAADRDHIRELLPLVALGIASPEEQESVRAALQLDAELALEANELEVALTGLGAAQSQTPPPDLKARLMAQARLEGAAKTVPDGVLVGDTVGNGVPRVHPTDSPAARSPSSRTEPSPARAPSSPTPRTSPRANRWLAPILAVGLSALAVVAGIVAVTRSATPALDAGVVATTFEGGLIYTDASNREAPAMLVGADWKTRPVRFSTPSAPYFTKAVSSEGLSYLLDAHNAKLFIVDEARGVLVDSWPVPDGASGLSVDGDMVCVVGASSGTVLTFRRNGIGNKTMVEARISNPHKTPLEDVMDAAEIRGDRVYVTHHATGLVTVIDLSTNRELRRARIGVSPVSLAFTDDALLVLDRAGTLYRLNPDTLEQTGSVKLEGAPDRIMVAPVIPGVRGAPEGIAYLSDRSGFVTAVNAVNLSVIARKNLGGKPMDLTVMPDGHIAVAGSRGVKILDDRLETVRSL